jgi:hypothetical protein
MMIACGVTTKRANSASENSETTLKAKRGMKNNIKIYLKGAGIINRIKIFSVMIIL